MKLRLDDLVVSRGLADSKSRAQALIRAGKIRSGTRILDKPGAAVAADLPLELEAPPRFVSRGGEKLEAALEAFPFDCTGKLALDVGASTGGFTDCILQRGAAHVTCVDVGRGQLHSRIASDPRIANFERLHARALPETVLPHPDYDLVVMDLSFISLTKVLDAVWPRVRTGGRLIALVKPQFEATKAEADRGCGVIRDDAVRERVLNEVLEHASMLPDCVSIGWIQSPLAGGDGNREFLAVWERRPAPHQS
jgi:23S rRNA (cytidine1920-2'-O)/16S rRNA (cytidine1409-2'-O)-methyltransferase